MAVLERAVAGITLPLKTHVGGEDEAYAAGSDDHQQFQLAEPNQRAEEPPSPSRCSHRPCISPSIPVLDCVVAYVVPPPESPVNGEAETNACAPSGDDHHQLQLVEPHQRDEEWSIAYYDKGLEILMATLGERDPPSQRPAEAEML
uniref:Uncharacterized protein n=1 Tax=Zea mays TaxID=4577 RepID=A0A804PXG4_MAIZE